MSQMAGELAEQNGFEIAIAGPNVIFDGHLMMDAGMAQAAGVAIMLAGKVAEAMLPPIEQAVLVDANGNPLVQP